MKILVEDIYSTMMNPRDNVKALSIIRTVCSARPAGYQFMPRYKAGHWDGFISLMEGIGKFPTGLLTFVTEALSDAGYDIELLYLTDYSSYSLVSSTDLHDIILRDYQVESANKLLEAHRGIAKMATNSGKTEVMAAIIHALGFPKTFIILHRKELLYQTAERFNKRLGIKCGLIGDGIWRPDQVTVAMIQTLSNRKEELQQCIIGNNLVMADECQHVSSDQMLNILHEIPGQFRYGFSGTPLDRDLLSDMKLISATGNVVCEISNEYLINAGYSAIPTVRLYTVEDNDDKNWKSKYPDAYSRLIVNNDVRNRKICELAQKAKGTVLILINRIAHGKNIQSLLPDSVFVCGSDTVEYRRSVLDAMRDGSGIFIASPIFDEGIDVPRIDTVILAGADKGYVRVLQRIGRGMRKKDGDNQLSIVDFIDDMNKYLLDHSRARIETYEKEGFVTKVVDN
jgi:superfamily II DNA or RNA helicase